MSLGETVRDPGVEADAHAAREGDLDALGRLFERYADPLYRFLVSRTRGDVMLAEDVAGETWARVATSIGGYTSRGGGFSAWLFTIGKRLLLDHHKASATRHEHLAPHMLTPELWRDEAAGPEHAALAGAASDAIAAAVEGLPTNQRRCLILHYWVGLSIADTAAAMGKTPKAAGSLLNRALRSLTPLLAAYAPRKLEAGTLLALNLNPSTIEYHTEREVA